MVNLQRRRMSSCNNGICLFVPVLCLALYLRHGSSFIAWLHMSAADTVHSLL